MRLDASVDVNSVKATHNNGILKLVLPKSEAAKTKKIAIDIK
jgi:HSP20 family molecular chaperone IbpA